VPVAQANPQFVLPAMPIPIEQQRLIAAQQAGHIPKGPALGQIEPTNSPPFYIPNKPSLPGPRAANTVVFTTAI